MYYTPFRQRFLAASAILTASHIDRAQVKDSPFLRGLADVVMRQAAWREAFASRLRGARRICVVGNAGAMNGSGMGMRIDDHDCVVRFNQYLGEHTRVEDVGSRTDIWVRMPGVPRPSVRVTADWVVLSGPDVRFRSSNWRAMESVIDAGKPIITVPLHIWRGLVARLAAPPSAGLLFLAWLREIRDERLANVSLVGFQRVKSLAGNYHHAIPDKQPGSRHEWGGERRLLQKWVERDGAVWLKNCEPKETLRRV